MRIGIDISVLQTPHRMRGIGYTLINFINHLPKSAKSNHEFIFFQYSTKSHEDPLELLDLQGMKYEIRTIKAIHKATPRETKLNKIRVFRIVNKLSSMLKNRRVHARQVRRGDQRIHELSDIDVFMQFDQNQPLPAKRKVKSLLVAYDIIPYVMESDYLWSYETARAKGRSRLSALRHALKRRSYLKDLRANIRKAWKVIAISEYTKKDLVDHVKVPAKKIHVCLLGVSGNAKVSKQKDPGFEKYIHSSWGYIPHPVELEGVKFLLFVGGADPRRRLPDLVAAFNNLRAQGENIKLVFAGDTMKGAFNVPNVEFQNYMKHTSYLNDIYFLGFVNDEQREWLYSHAVAFVYPSVYEGFGLPVLEAMQYGTPVITYENSSIKEIAGEAALYAHDYQSIAASVTLLLTDDSEAKKYAKRGKQQAGKFSWESTAEAILKEIES